MFELAKEENATIGPKMASALLTKYNTLEAQRGIKAWKVREYRKHILYGTFRKAPIVLATDLETQRTYMVDGQHRLKTLESYGLEIDASIE